MPRHRSPPGAGLLPFLAPIPIALAAPRSGTRPLVIDMATSATARVNVMEAAARGTPIPPGWALDAEGRSTTDAAAGLAGSIAPVGGAKGYGLALMVELLAAGVTGSNWSFQTSSLTDNEGGPPDIGQLFIAINPARFGGSNWQSRLEELTTEIQAQENARLPGDRRLQAQRPSREIGGRGSRRAPGVDREVHVALIQAEPLSAREILELLHLDIGEPVTVTSLAGGYRNLLQRVEVEGFDVVIKQYAAPDDNPLFPLLFEDECRALASFRNAGIAPRLIAAEPERRLLVYQFVPGDPWNGDVIAMGGSAEASGGGPSARLAPKPPVQRRRAPFSHRGHPPCGCRILPAACWTSFRSKMSHSRRA